MADGAWSGNDAERLMLTDPARAQAMLRGYFWLLYGQDLLWWQRVKERKNPNWPACIKRAIERAARRAQVSPVWLGSYLDLTPCNGARDMIIANARAYLAETD